MRRSPSWTPRDDPWWEDDDLLVGSQRARRAVYREFQVRARAGLFMSDATAPDPAHSPHAEDLALVSRALAGDARASEEVAERLLCVPTILRERHWRLGAPLQPDELEDAQQDTLVALWTKLAEYRGLASLEAWCFRFAVNELLRAIERKRRRAWRTLASPEEALEGVPTPEADELALDHAVLTAALERLPEAAADVIRARHFGDLTFEALSRTSREPISTLKARYYRGLSELRRFIEPHHRKMTP